MVRNPLWATMRCTGRTLRSFTCHGRNIVSNESINWNLPSSSRAAILAVPAVAAQQVTDQLVKAGIETILNFAPVRVGVPDTVTVRQVDLSMELQVLSYYGRRTPA